MQCIFEETEVNVENCLVDWSPHLISHRAIKCPVQMCNIANQNYERKSKSKLQIIIGKKQMVIMTYKQHLFFNVISKQI